MAKPVDSYFSITEKDLYNIFLTKHGNPENAGWSPKRRLKFNYHQPQNYYAALVNKFVNKDTMWIDVGSGSTLFPDNIELAKILSEKASLVVGVDPSNNINNNPFVHEKAMCLIEDYQPNLLFDLVTMRMVAEHVQNPSKLIYKLKTLLKEGGKVIVYTVNRWSPVTIISDLVPFKLHFPIKKLFYGGEEKDTFPTYYKMNTRKKLKLNFERYGAFKEIYFCYLDDCSTFGKFKNLNYLELSFWRILNSLGFIYPENCILSVYEKCNKDVNNIYNKSSDFYHQRHLAER